MNKKRVGILLLTLTAVAQDKPNFSGSWLLEIEKSDFSHFPVPVSQTNAIEHKDVNIRLTQIIRNSSGPDGEISLERRYTTDGKENLNKLGPLDAKSTSTWAGNKLTIATRWETPAGTGEMDESWELTEGGKQMVVSRDFKEPDGGGVQRLLFKRQQ